MEEFLPASETPTREMKSETMEPTLYRILEELTGKGLECQGITTWSRFVNMDEEDIPRMTIDIDGTQVPLPRHWIRMIYYLKRLIWENIECRVPGAELASMYTSKMFNEYVHGIKLSKYQIKRRAELERFKITLMTFEKTTPSSHFPKTFEEDKADVESELILLNQAIDKVEVEKILTTEQRIPQIEAIELQRQAEAKRRHTEDERIDATAAIANDFGTTKTLETTTTTVHSPQTFATETTLDSIQNYDDLRNRDGNDIEDDIQDIAKISESFEIADTRRLSKPRRLSDSFDPDKTSFHSLKTKIINDRRLSKLRKPKTFRTAKLVIHSPETFGTMETLQEEKADFQNRDEFRNGNDSQNLLWKSKDFRNCEVSKHGRLKDWSELRRLKTFEHAKTQGSKDVPRTFEFKSKIHLARTYPFHSAFHTQPSKQVKTEYRILNLNLNLHSFEESFETMKISQNLKTFEDRLPPAEPPPAEPPPEPPPARIELANPSAHQFLESSETARTLEIATTRLACISPCESEELLFYTQARKQAKTAYQLLKFILSNLNLNSCENRFSILKTTPAYPSLIDNTRPPTLLHSREQFWGVFGISNY